jgi:hypothetical protein
MTDSGSLLRQLCVEEWRDHGKSWKVGVAPAAIDTYDRTVAQIIISP